MVLEMASTLANRSCNQTQPVTLYYGVDRER